MFSQDFVSLMSDQQKDRSTSEVDCAGALKAAGDVVGRILRARSWSLREAVQGWSLGDFKSFSKSFIGRETASNQSKVL